MPHLLDEYAYSFCTFYDKIGKVKINTNYLSSLCKIFEIILLLRLCIFCVTVPDDYS